MLIPSRSVEVATLGKLFSALALYLKIHLQPKKESNDEIDALLENENFLYGREVDLKMTSKQCDSFWKNFVHKAKEIVCKAKKELLNKPTRGTDISLVHDSLLREIFSLLRT
ncbi:MAG: hypothetical protein HC921_16690 [Synechococcaceae cyanobacterium SM2_3_1]|nr:hypothetical protein [Synechococcaceae cyanobacterium SM2_3_1]